MVSYHDKGATMHIRLALIVDGQIKESIDDMETRPLWTVNDWQHLGHEITEMLSDYREDCKRAVGLDI